MARLATTKSWPKVVQVSAWLKSRSAVICQNCVSRFMIHWRPMAFMFSQLTWTQKARLFELTSGSQPLIDPPPAASGAPPAQGATTGRDSGQARTGTVSEQGKDWSSHCRSMGWPRATPPPPQRGPPKVSPALSQDQVRNRGPTAPQGDSREKSPEAPAAPRGAEQQPHSNNHTFEGIDEPGQFKKCSKEYSQTMDRGYVLAHMQW